MDVESLNQSGLSINLSINQSINQFDEDLLAIPLGAVNALTQFRPINGRGRGREEKKTKNGKKTHFAERMRDGSERGSTNS